ncbi:MAG: carboxypeptidase-like regulatory domain-containing protein [Planctomycetota bacterium]|nr:carboxypeptidase-like regulatory domain-containing protein [Planctomycetota bacterium]
MLKCKTICRSAAFLALAVTALGQPAYLLAANPSSKTDVVDVALQGNNELHGRVINAEGQAVSGSIVVLTDSQNVPLVRTVADEDGRFAFSQVPTGTAVLYTEQSQTPVRTWAADTAPPVAQPEVILNENGPTVRGQLGGIDVRTATILTAWGVGLGIGVYYGVRDAS